LCRCHEQVADETFVGGSLSRLMQQFRFAVGCGAAPCPGSIQRQFRKGNAEQIFAGSINRLLG
jgi:hypothetical protein